MASAADMIEMANSFFDAIESRDMAAVAALLHPELEFWTNFGQETKSRDEILSSIEQGYALHRRRTYDDRRIKALADGFVAQYTCRIVRHDGSSSALWAASVVKLRDGQIVRVDEYMDSGKFVRPAAA